MTTKKKTKKKAKAKKKTNKKVKYDDKDLLPYFDTEATAFKPLPPLSKLNFAPSDPPFVIETSRKLKTFQELVAQKEKPLPLYKRIWQGTKRFFSRLIPTSRDVKFWFQRLFRGWDDSELWNLDNTLAKYILPRLKRFRELTCAYPGNDDFKTHEEWEEALDKMIYAMEVYSYGVTELEIEDVEWDVVDEGLRLFGKHFGYLWW